MSNVSTCRTNFCYLSNDVICIPKPVDRKIILPRVITLPHFLQHIVCYISTKGSKKKSKNPERCKFRVILFIFILTW